MNGIHRDCDQSQQNVRVSSRTLQSGVPATLNLTVNSDNTVGGTIRMTGTSTATVLSGTTSRFRCEPNVLSFNDQQPVSGSIYRITWTTDLGDFNLLRGAFTGQLVPAQVTGNIGVSYSLGAITLIVRLTLGKQ